MKEIFTTGYPKSGNTWLIDLISYMLEAPSSKDVNIKPKTLKDDKYVVYKLHIPQDPELPSYYCYTDELRDRIKKGELIFIHRDPRSVMVSAWHYGVMIDIPDTKCEYRKAHNNLYDVILQQMVPYKLL